MAREPSSPGAPAPRNPPLGEIRFIDSHAPPMEAGDYEITVVHDFAAPAVPSDFAPATMRAFSVRGERFALAPSDIFGVFPPAGSVGDHSAVLPHVIFERSTLPWERRAPAKGPWLAVLVFHPDDPQPTSKVVTAGDLGVPLEAAQHPADPVRVIDVDPTLLEAIRPLPDELRLLTHVRQGWLPQAAVDKSELSDFAGDAASLDAGKLSGELRAAAARQGLDLPAALEIARIADGHWSVGDPTPPGESWEIVQNDDGFELLAPGERAVVVASRLPAPGGISTAYLVSLENEVGGVEGQHRTRLVALASWRFTCVAAEPSFAGLLTGLDSGAPRLPAAAVELGSRAERYRRAGYVPLVHDLRQGSTTYSWYRGPLSPVAGEVEPDAEPPSCADELLRYHEAVGMFDISYAAAWELGRLTMLGSRAASVALYGWKRAWRQGLSEAGRRPDHLPFAGAAPPAEPEPPGAVVSFFTELALLHGLPFHYLVPDERLLPAESIRFFRVDPYWMKCLLDGAFSIGGAAGGADAGLLPVAPAVSGFLMRSEVVSGWPGLEVDGYSQPVSGATMPADSPKARIVRMERLSPEILLCLFAGEVQTVDLHLHAETLHFGFDDKGGGDLVKVLRDPNTGQLYPDKASGNPVTIPWRDEDRRLVQVLTLDKSGKPDGGLAKRVADCLGETVEADRTAADSGFGPADFALQMIEGVPRVRFTIA